MADERGTLREVVWQEICPWLILVRALRVSLRLRVLLLAAAGLIATSAGWRIVGDLFAGGEADRLEAWIEVDRAWPWQIPVSTPTVADPLLTISQVVRSLPLVGGVLSAEDVDININPLDAWLRLSWPFLRMFDVELTGTELCYLLVCGVWQVIVWALFGGAITRIAAMELTRRESLGMRAAIGQTSARIGSYLAAPLLPLLAIGCVCLLPLGIGLLARLPFLLWLAGLFWFLLLLVGFALAVLTIGFLIGWPFLWATLSVERTDAFDALSRTYAYVYQRPLRLLFYAVVTVLLGMLGGLVVYVFGTATQSLADWSFRWGVGRANIQQMELERGRDERIDAMEFLPSEINGEAIVPSPSDAPRLVDPPTNEDISPLERGAATLSGFWIQMLQSIMAGFPVGFVWVSGIGIYLLLRRDIDAAEMDEVALEEQENVYGLPPLKEDASGIPQVDEEDTATDRGEPAGEQTP